MGGVSSQDSCLKIGSAYVIVYSVTDRASFDSAAELRITLRRARQAENLPIILVGNKSDLVRSREVAVEGEGQRLQAFWHAYLKIQIIDVSMDISIIVNDSISMNINIIFNVTLHLPLVI